MRSTKVIVEEIEEAELLNGKHYLQAKAIFERAKNIAAKTGQDPTATEQHAFDQAADAALAEKQKIAQLQTELEQAQNFERQIVMSRNPNAIVYGQANYTGDQRPQRILPTNGIMPDGDQLRYGRPSRMARLKAFRDEQSAYDAGIWYKAVVARAIHGTIDARAEDYCNRVGMEIVNVGTEGSGVAGGYLVPAPLSSAIIEVRERVGIARQVCNVMPMTSDTLTVPKKTGGLTVYIVGEATAITESDKTWGSVAVATKKRACLSYLSQELNEDAIINMVDNIVSEQAYALALQEDDELINGAGLSTHGFINGLLASIGSAGVSTAATGHDTWGELDMADMTACVGKLPDRYFTYEPSWICSHSFFNAVMVRLAFAAGGVTASEVMGGTPNVRSFLGYKVFLTSKMPTATAAATKACLFGAFDQAVILGDRGGIRVQRSDDIKFVEDLIALKAVSRYDMNVHDKGDGSNAGAYVSLATAS